MRQGPELHQFGLSSRLSICQDNLCNGVSMCECLCRKRGPACVDRFAGNNKHEMAVKWFDFDGKRTPVDIALEFDCSGKQGEIWLASENVQFKVL